MPASNREIVYALKVLNQTGPGLQAMVAGIRRVSSEVAIAGQGFTAYGQKANAAIAGVRNNLNGLQSSVLGAGAAIQQNSTVTVDGLNRIRS